MPMIDVYAPRDLFPDGTDRKLAEELTLARLHAEGVQKPAPVQLNNTAAYIHRLDPKAVHTAGTDSARTVRLQVMTPPGALNRAGQRSFVAKATAIIASVAGDPTQATRTGYFCPKRPKAAGGLPELRLAAKSSRRSRRSEARPSRNQL